MHPHIPCPLIIACVFTLAGVAFGQSAFLPGNEYRIVENTPSSEGVLSIGVQPDGSSWVVCEGGGVWLKPDLTVDSGFVSFPSLWSFALPFSKNRWVNFTVSHESEGGGPHWSGSTYFRFGIFKDKVLLGQSPVVAERYQSQIDDLKTIGTLICYNAFVLGNAVFFVSNKIHSMEGMMNIREYFATIDIWNPDSALDKVKTIFRPEWYRWPGGCFFGEPLISSFPESDDRVLIMLRKCDDQHSLTSRAFYWYLNQSDSLSEAVMIDTLADENTDLSDLLLPCGTENVYDVHRLVPGDTVIAERISKSGKVLAVVNTGITQIRQFVSEQIRYLIADCHQVRSIDLTGKVLPDGRYILAWSGKGDNGTFEAYVALFDSTMTMIGVPKRLNSDVENDQYSPAIALHGDSVYAVWRSRDRLPDGLHHTIHARKFAPDQVLAADRPEVPTAPTFAAWPDPARDAITAAVAGFGAARIDLVDMLGRVVLTRDIAPQQDRISLPCRDVPAGVYILRVVSDKMPVVRRIRIVR